MALTKVSGGILDPGINVAGIVTATGFDGPFTGGSSSNINAGIITATGFDLNGNGDISGNLVIGGNLTANGDFTTLNTTLREVEILRVDANSSEPAGIITQRGSGDILNLYDGSTEVFSVADGGDVTAVGNIKISNTQPTLTFDDTNHQDFTIAAVGNALHITDANNGNRLLFNANGSNSLYGFLSVSGNLSATGTYYVSDEIQHSSDSDTKIRFPAADTFTVETGGSERLRITSDGKVGMGVTSTSPGGTCNPDGNQLLIRGPSTFQTTKGHIMLTGDGATNGEGPQIVFSESGSGGNFAGAYIGHVRLGSNSIGDLVFGTRSTSGDANTVPKERLRIASDGKIFVGNHAGTIDTTARLGEGNTFQLSGLASNDGISVLRYNSSFGTYGLNIGRSKSNTLGTNVALQDDDEIGHVTFWGADGGDFNMAAQITAKVTGTPSNGTDMPGSLLFKTTPDASGTPTEKLRITPAGQVVIGTGGALSLLTLRSSGSTEITLVGGDTTDSGIYFNDGANDGAISYHHGDRELRFRSGGSTRWKFDQNGNFLPNAAAAVNIGSTSAEIGDVYLADSKKIHLGSDQDFTLYHNNSHAIVKNTTGRLYVLSDDLWFKNQADNSNLARFLNGDTSIFYFAGNEKLRTHTTGISVTGEVAASQDYPNFRPTLDFNFAAEKKLDPRITYQRTGVASFVNEFGKVVLVGDNAPRFDHDPDTGECKGLLIEESRTNIAPYTDLSEYGGHNITKTANNAVAPDGTTTAAKIEHGGSGTSYLDHINTSINAQNAGNYTYSVWLKAPDDQPDGYYGCRIAVLHSTGGNVEPTVSLNKTWTRYSVTKNFGASDGGNLRVHLVMFRASPGGTYDGKVIPSYVWAWGAQIEQGAFSTSYIPTAGATRGQDLVEITGEEFSEFYNRTEGSFASEIMLKPSYPVTGYASYMMSLSDSSYNNRVTLGSSTGSAAFNADVTVGGTNYRASLGSYTSGSHSIKAAMAYKSADSAGSLNGAEAVTASPSGTLPLLTRADIGKDHGNFNPLNGHMKRLMYYSKRLPNNQLRTLTS